LPAKIALSGVVAAAVIDRRMRLLSYRRAEFEILDLPKLTIETLDIIRFEYLDEHADAFFKSRSALRGLTPTRFKPKDGRGRCLP